MKIPKMVLFDYGQTLIAEQVQAKANEINRKFGRFDPEKRHLFQIEIPNTMFTPYLYESQGIEIALGNSEILCSANRTKGYSIWLWKKLNYSRMKFGISGISMNAM